MNRYRSTTPHRFAGVRLGATAIPAVGLAVVFIGLCTELGQRVGLALFGPPKAQSNETYATQPDGPGFDHSPLDRLLKQHVAPGGWVDYDALATDPHDLDRYIEALSQTPFDDLGRNQKLALLINAYNAFTLRLILDHYPVDSIKDIPAGQRWDAKRWRIGRYTWSLNQIEHEQVRPHFREPRIHFALVCAAVGCPPLRSEAYTPSRLDQQLEDQTQYIHTHNRWYRFDPQSHSLALTSLYNWYGGDFEQDAGSVIDFVTRYAPALRQAINTHRRPPKPSWLPYDWSLNSVSNAPKGSAPK